MVTLQKFTNLLSLLSYFKDETICKLQNDLDGITDIDFNNALKTILG